MNAPTRASRLEALLLRDRLLVWVGLTGIIALSWLWLWLASRDMYGEMTGWSAWMMVDHWTPAYFLMIFAMWSVMMLGMMLPSAAPVLLLYGRIVRSRADGDRPVLRQYAFAAGYALSWTAFSLAASLLQWLLNRVALLNPMMELKPGPVAAALLLLVGLYQWTPLKHACLARCQSSAVWLSENWRPGAVGALRMGVQHGLYCVGCCWALMLLLFVGGVMSIAWIAGLTLAVFIEKLAPPRMQAARILGLVFIAGSLTILLRP